MELMVTGRQDNFILEYFLLELGLRFELGWQARKLMEAHSAVGVLVLDHEELELGFKTLGDEELGQNRPRPVLLLDEQRRAAGNRKEQDG